MVIVIKTLWDSSKSLTIDQLLSSKGKIVKTNTESYNKSFTVNLSKFELRYIESNGGAKFLRDLLLEDFELYHSDNLDTSPFTQVRDKVFSLRLTSSMKIRIQHRGGADYIRSVLYKEMKTMRRRELKSRSR